MHVVPNLRPKKASDLVPGELIRFHFKGKPGATLALLLKMEDGDPVYGILRGPDFATPLLWYVGNSSDKCLSYGVDWLLEVREGQNTSPGDTPPPGHVVSVFYDREGVAVAFNSSPQFPHQTIYFHLSKSELVRYDPTVSAPVLSWAVWASTDQFTNPRSTPLFEYPPQP